jgi:DNA (cytosine-5)-methyltransferase 1
MKKIYYTSLFSCAGIGETFLHKLGIESALANELLGNRALWYLEKYKNTTMIPGDIMDDKVFNQLVAQHLEKKIAMSLQSCPCQDFSTAGKRDTSNPRAFLYERGLEFLEKVNSVNQYAFIENVPAFLSAKLDGKVKIIDIIKAKLYELGYKDISVGVLNASNYGIPQHRRRAFILASKVGPWVFPKKENIKVTVRDAIGHLPPLESGEVSDIPYHYAPYWDKRYTDIMKHTPTGCSAFLNSEPWKPVNKNGLGPEFYRSSWRRAKWDEPCGSILMKSAGMGGMISCHPGTLQEDGTYNNARAYTIKELLLLTGLPDNYKIPAFALNNDELIRDVIGECVCPGIEYKIMQNIPRK